MKTAKKVLSVLLSLTMLLGVFSLIASAEYPDAAVDMYLKTDKSTYAPGETVVITISVKTIEDVGPIYCGGQFGILFNDNVLEPFNLTENKPASKQGCKALNGGINDALSGVTMPSAFESEIDENEYGYNAGIAPKFVTEKSMQVDCTQEVKDLFCFNMNVKADAQPGIYHIGYSQQYIVDYVGFLQDVALNGIYGWDDDNGYGTTVNYALHDCEFTVANEASTGPVVEKASTKGTEVKFTTNAPGADGVDDEFKLRIRSQISDADWDTYFAQTATGDESKNAITEVGVVAYQGTDGFDAETAKKVVNGEPTEKYESAGTNYIQKAGESDDAYFGAIIELKHSTCDYDITFMGYAKYLDADGQPQVAFYKTSEVAKVSTNYDSAVSAFKAL